MAGYSLRPHRVGGWSTTHFLALSVCVFSDTDAAKVKSNTLFFTVAISNPPPTLRATAGAA
jgi:hypothetical protein